MVEALSRIGQVMGRGSLVGRTIAESRPVHIPDAPADPEYTNRDFTRITGARSMLGVPLLRDGRLYVFCFDINARKTTAHVNQSVIGSAPGDIKEKDGSPLGEKVFAAMKEESITTVSYNFPKPGTTEPVPKESYVTRVGNQGCGVGYYK
jgi:signal transduction histidine kinase